ncbi:radical SAM family RiPP maturation amino acid epimerase [Bradyrhizobium niftali]|jgi:radical SAM family RiPP maturation amino acid epimerase|uniref:Radical SAM family RiPP maturation amino acid epimerase n=1 Tax=Bradyrhizobium niftali TaxID=2560055 RepID=A0A4Y9M2H9_9BRAD|nr:radical SAM family RiPP maturation amino acid epimerase [Bradyrhizobium niftali]TFV49238.1 radical SAM family RiPP maturation amino acid epimerase [Bradyrhizobium niftali]
MNSSAASIRNDFQAPDETSERTMRLFELAGLQPPAADDITPFSDIKRFEERWHGDHKFRAAYAQDPDRVGVTFGLRVDPEVVRPIWDPEHPGRDESACLPVWVRYRDFQRRGSKHLLDAIAAGKPADPRFARWRQRQIYRANLEIGVSLTPNPHIPASFELSRGCSVGCWFCSLSPPKLDDVFQYTPEHARLWREILEVIRVVSGPAARRTICYSGTEPFDNPHYERFVADFVSAFSDVPFTSTAIPTRDVERTRRLLATSPAYRVRFSVLSVGALAKIHAAFSPEETLPVLFGLRNEGATDARYVNFAGRARDNVAKYRKYQPGPPVISTPSCESGFKFNLAERTIRLVSPCAPDDRWPMGYRVYDETRFETGRDVARTVEDMMSRHMTRTARDLPVLRFPGHLRYQPINTGFALIGRRLRQRFEDTFDMPSMARLGELIAAGKHSASAIVTLFDRECGVTQEAVTATLEELFHLGVLDEDLQEPDRALSN